MARNRGKLLSLDNPIYWRCSKNIASITVLHKSTGVSYWLIPLSLWCLTQQIQVLEMLVIQILKDPDHEIVILTLGAGEHSDFHD